VRGTNRSQLAADMCVTGSQTSPSQADRKWPQVSRQGATDGPDHPDVVGRALFVPDHRVPAGHTRPAHAAARQAVLSRLLPEHG